MQKKGEKNNPLVYSTEYDRVNPRCGQSASLCGCGTKNEKTKSDGIVRVSRSARGRKGKGVMVITGVPLDSGGLRKLGKELKVKFGVGGSVKNGIIEMQGDFREKIQEELKKHGWTVKLSGG